MDPAGNLVFEQSGMMQINEPPAGIVDLESPAILVFDLPLPVAGEYAFVITVDQIQAARTTFLATAVGGPTGQMH
jgi:hypothetical protein